MFLFAVISFLSITQATASPPAVDRSSVLSTARAFVPNSEAKVSVETQEDPYAIVEYRAGNIEGRLSDGQILLQRFAFGWQVIDAASDPPGFTSAALHNHGISAPVARALLHGVVAGALPPGRWNDADHGSSEDITAIRETVLSETGEAISSVKIYEEYAVLTWFSRSGGERVFAKRDGRWVAIVGGGGCLDKAGFIHYGVSSQAAAQFSLWFPCGPFPATTPATAK
ncbi:MAG: hypothetical protein JOY86_01890 [Candidatus Eremiobacteraeota bacterium]|nr:hypothetical protein [Candidatus Eremiobacteraeota bacterium]